MDKFICDHDNGKCYDVDERGHLPAVFSPMPRGYVTPSIVMGESLDPREAVYA